MQNGSSRSALFSAAATGVSLTGVLLYLWFFFELDTLNLQQYLLPALLVAILFISVTVYQSVRIVSAARSLAKNIAEDILLYSRELFSELYRNSPVPYVLISAHGVVESTNYAAVRLFHIEEGALDGKDIFEFLETDDDDLVGLIAEKLKQGLFVNEEEVRIKRFDGSTRWVLLSLFSFTDTSRERKGLLTMVDVTKQKQIDKAKTEFVSLASHQLRTPISAMKWNIELLHGANPNGFTPMQEEYLLKVVNGLTRMDILVQDFLNVSKLELGTLVAEVSDFELRPFIAEILDEYRKRAEVAEVAVSESWSEEPFMVRSDQKLLTMIVSNLVSNAIKYTPSGGQVTLAFTRENDAVTIMVKDTGMGIPEDEQEQVFSKIFRASNARAQVAEGTGLGLYIVREAARVMHGDVTFTSEEGVGTTFIVTLPH